MITYLFIKYLILHLRYTKILKKVYKDENLLDNLSSLFKVPFKMDWMGRVYAVFNPHIQDGVFNPNNQIYEYDENGLTNKAYIESYIMNQLNIAKRFILASNLFDLLTYKIKKIDDHDNYLFIMQSITYDDFEKATKRFIWLFFSLCLIITSILIYYFK